MKQLSQGEWEELNRYLDDDLDGPARKDLEQRLESNESLRAAYVALADAHRLLAAQTRLEPPRNFTEKVMTGLDQYAPPRFSMSVRNGVFLLIGVLLAVVVTLYFAATGLFNGDVSIAHPFGETIQQQLAERHLPPVSFDGKMLVHAIVLLNLVLAWIVLDRTILRPLFRRRLAAQ